MQIYLVATCTSSMVGIEKCCIIIVPPASQAAFVQQYAGRILITGCSLTAWPSYLPIFIYKGH